MYRLSVHDLNVVWYFWQILEEFVTLILYKLALIVALWVIMGLSQLLQLLPTELTLIINPP